ncbi:TetR/AcrR family transcriptional regulator C-terminal domain-containing protein [Amycolatopsis acidiphila]|uniref:TetR family transcriptional regulator n=1 Tax=Amycolatopsis acidiphila TaxID=715473 RepID=A0A557ZWV3_9PSEU|nr:TetR/AcrR family transcriptional regulator C-terminal domain-containing protein [Amycolatopsis acidiphila]TVT16482.1 TetR family transcriptional regulator [Amycolatopsis acidiphila]UIJ60883.1 TetR/AcrR family transcriptional regulator C-terminal domain-containing protein [Amycolatopsis acidiphila]GHG95000.1 TetR family transcriptional regulator [Amycolatopsis acidiphila]
MPRPRSLNPAQLAAAALAVLDRDGLDGLSMRAVGKELGMSTMSLYRYVTDRGQLEELVVDLVLGLTEFELPDGTPYERLRILAERVREAVGAHSAVVPLLLIHRHKSIASRQWGEVVLGVLTDAGFTGRARVIAFRAYLSYVLGALQTGYHSPLAGAGTTALREQEHFAVLAETAHAAGQVSAEEEFREGLELLLRGFKDATKGP